MTIALSKVIDNNEVIAKVREILIANGKFLNVRDFGYKTIGYLVVRRSKAKQHTVFYYLRFIDELTNKYGDYFQELKGEITKAWVDDIMANVRVTGNFNEKDTYEYARALCELWLDNHDLYAKFVVSSQAGVFREMTYGPKTVSRINTFLTSVGIDLKIPNNSLYAYNDTPTLHNDLRDQRVSIGLVLCSLRTERNLTQQDAANLIGYSVSLITKMEVGGYRHIDKRIDKFLIAYNVSDIQYRLIMGMIRNYHVIYVKAAMEVNGFLGVARLGEALIEYIEVIRSALHDRNYGINDVFENGCKLLEGYYKKGVIRVVIFQRINHQLRLRNILPKHDNYLFEI